MEQQTLNIDLEAELKRYFQLDAFREGQKEIIETVLNGVPVLAILPTGGGKSLCYQLPSLLSEGVSLVISPLIALMKDQIDALVERGMSATFINSSLTNAEYNERMQKLAANHYKIVYVAPERFRNAAFRKALQGLKIAIFAIDEAHCISYWGHDFRPDYRRLHKAIETLRPKNVIALTATATAEVQQDIVNQLGLPYMERFVAGFDRKNLTLQVTQTDSNKDKFAQLEKRIRKEKGSIIVYCATRKNTEKVTDYLISRGYKVGCYHGGMEDSERTRIQDEFMSEKLQIVVATNAFGMGIDKKDIREVIHYDIPGTIEAYYQEAGRAGRDGLPSVCTILFQYADKHILEFFIEGSHPNQQVIEEIYAALLLLRDENGRIETSMKDIFDHVKSAQNEMSIHSGLKILEEANLLERTHRNENLCTIVLLDTLKNVLFRLRKASGHRVDLILHLQKEYDFQEGTLQLLPNDLIQKSGLTEEQLKRALNKLVEERLIQYIPPHRGRGINLLEPLYLPKKLPIDFAQIKSRADREYEKLQTMFRYAFHIACRRQFILEYFGDVKQIRTCASCDNCLREVSPLTPEQKLVVVKILSCVARMNGRFGKIRIAQVLTGSKSKEILETNLEQLSTYNILPDFTQDRILSIIDALVHLEALKVNAGNYPTLSLSPFGKKVMLSQAEVQFPFPEESKKERKEPTVVSGQHRDLFKQLKELRMELARENDVPAYRIFNDNTLLEFCRFLPKNAEEMLLITGVGPVLMQKYGTHFLGLIRQYHKTQKT